MQTVALTIGLGNNCFQWAFGQSLRAKGINVQYQFLNSANPHTGHNTKGYHSLSPYGIEIQTDRETPRQTLNERTFAYDPSVYNEPDGTLFVGCWQSEKYFVGIEDQLRKEFVLKSSPSIAVQRVIERIKQTPSCFIHVRRGDYTLPKNVEYHGDGGGLEYYKTAIQYVKDQVPGVVFYLFSDDLRYCQENFPDIECVSLLKFDKYNDLLLMSGCKHGIGANSSFSWWANWLGDYPGRICVFPKKWFNGANLDTKDLIPTRWVTL